MSITVHYFASLKEQLGRASDQVEYAPQLTVQDVWLRVNQDNPLPASVLAAINMDYVPFTALVEDNDTVAFFPPVTGG